MTWHLHQAKEHHLPIGREKYHKQPQQAGTENSTGQ